MAKVQITGSRDWEDYDTIENALVEHGATEVIHGACRGADLLADKAARAIGLQVHSYPADWITHGRAAGPRRNAKMLEEHPDSDIVLVFHDDLDISKGTGHMVGICKKAGKKIYHYYHRVHRKLIK